jgi:hypothetical protein
VGRPSGCVLLLIHHLLWMRGGRFFRNHCNSNEFGMRRPIIAWQTWWEWKCRWRCSCCGLRSELNCMVSESLLTVFLWSTDQNDVTYFFLFFLEKIPITVSGLRKGAPKSTIPCPFMPMDPLLNHNEEVSRRCAYSHFA